MATKVEFFGGPGGEYIVEDGQRRPRHINEAADPGCFIHHIAGTVRPEGATRQVLSCALTSHGSFGGTSHTHAGIILQSMSTKDWNRGRGVIFGHQILDAASPEGCPDADPGQARVQPETWWTVSRLGAQEARNHVWGPPKCSLATLKDGVPYDVAVSVGGNGRIEWSFKGPYIHIRNAVWDTANPETRLLAGLTGYSFFMVFASQTNDWSLAFENIQCRWE